MKRIICTLIMTIGFSMVSFAGEWKQDTNGWWYQNDDGTYKTGWYQDADSKWYYFDNANGYMLTNTITPDGYKLSEDGVWIEGDVKETKDLKGYGNKVELQATAYNLPIGDRELGYSLPVTVYYNNEYENSYDGKINIKTVELSKSGVPYLQFNVSTESRICQLGMKYKYNFSSGPYESDESIFTSCKNGGDDISWSLLSGKVKGDIPPTSLEIYIDKAELK